MARSEDRQRVAKILRRLERAYPNAKLALHYSSPFELLVALILAAQCTDEKVNQVTAELFRRYPRPQDFVQVPREELERAIYSTGFYRQKAKALQECCRALVERFGGKVPDNLEDLLTLPGVGRKTANILLGNAFGKPAIGVDTHVLRLAQRLGLTDHDHPDKVEEDLNEVVPVKDRTRFCILLQAHGRQVCLARKPRCYECVIADLCPYPDKTPAPASANTAAGRGRRGRSSK
ncbi:MAG: endonuclease III [Candidatus Binatia bacterium]|nr:MAG: endonuclease III [Candidatus Binatia bacterium]